MSDQGLIQKDGYRRNRVSTSVALVVTDRNLVFVAVEGDGTDAGRLGYETLASIEVERETLVITTTDGVNWRFPLTSPESEAVDIATRHLCWIGEIRNRLLSLQNDVELAVGKIRTLTADFEWDEALETYRETRNQLDDLICLVQCTTPLSNDVLAPELTGLDRRLEGACARLFIERSRSQLELATQLLQYRDYEQARKVFEEAYEYCERAEWHTEEVKRADAFQFGEQRDLLHSLEELRWEMESAAAEPLQEAEEAKVQADIVETAEAEVDHLEMALQHYRGIQTLEWGDGQYVTGDPEPIEQALQETAVRLTDRHEQAARERWNEGARLERNEQLQSAIRECTVAIEHIERAQELADEFDPEQTDKFESRLQQMFETLIEMRNDAPGEAQDDTYMLRGSSSTPDAENVDSDVPKDTSLSGIPEVGRGDDIPSIAEITELDLHHDITLELEGDDDPLDVSRDDTREGGKQTHESNSTDEQTGESNSTDEQTHEKDTTDEAEHKVGLRRSNETESV